MGRVVKRVPMDFDWPLGKVWKGYLQDGKWIKEHFGGKYPYLNELKDDDAGVCRICEKHRECDDCADYCIVYRHRNEWYREPPEGIGFQCWETTSEGSPISPVFASMEELCEWLAKNETIFAFRKADAAEWMSYLYGEPYRLKDVKGNVYVP